MNRTACLVFALLFFTGSSKAQQTASRPYVIGSNYGPYDSNADHAHVMRDLGFNMFHISAGDATG